jgi:endonuclease/exonuclease/phosphatase family metal-dependent hydrolase
MSFKVLTWNVENFLTVGADSGPKTQAEYDAKLATIRRVIVENAPDVVALQEVGGPGADGAPNPLGDLANALGAGTYTTHLSPNPDARGIRVAILAKVGLGVQDQPDILALPAKAPLPFSGIDGKPLERLGRGAVHLRLQAEGKTLHVINAHLKSKLLTFPNGHFDTKDENLRSLVAAAALARRCAEATAIRMVVSGLRKNAPAQGVIVLGDLNDEPSAATTQMLYGKGGSQPDTLRAFDRADLGDAQRLFNLGAFIPQERRYSRIYEGHKELIDHILVSLELVPQLDQQKKRHPLLVDSLVDYGAGGFGGDLPSVTEQPAERQGKPASDHAPILAEFDLS